MRLAPLLTSLLAAFALPLSAQAWDVRLDMPFPKGQNLPQTLVVGARDTVSGSLDTGRGYLLSVDHRILRINPVLKFQWGVELAHWTADGQIRQGADVRSSKLDQYGLGLQVDAQFWIPFTGVAGELGLVERVHQYKFQGFGASETEHLFRTWLRVGVRARLPLPLFKPYVAASYQQPLSRNRPVASSTAASVGDYLKAQGSGQEFERLWTFGLGLEF